WNRWLHGSTERSRRAGRRGHERLECRRANRLCGKQDGLSRVGRASLRKEAAERETLPEDDRLRGCRERQGGSRRWRGRRRGGAIVENLEPVDQRGRLTIGRLEIESYLKRLVRRGGNAAQIEHRVATGVERCRGDRLIRRSVDDDRRRLPGSATVGCEQGGVRCQGLPGRDNAPGRRCDRARACAAAWEKADRRVGDLDLVGGRCAARFGEARLPAEGVNGEQEVERLAGR